MTNWCSNNLMLSHDDPKQIFRVLVKLAVLDARENAPKKDRSDSVATPGLLGAFHPMPIAIATSDDQEKDKEGFSEPVQYVWAKKNWGPKWDVFSAWLGDEDDSPNNANRVTVAFRTAWTPPLPWLKHMGELGFTYWVRFVDEGGCFAGVATNDNTKRTDLCGTFEINSPAFVRVFGRVWEEFSANPDYDLRQQHADASYDNDMLAYQVQL